MTYAKKRKKPFELTLTSTHDPSDLTNTDLNQLDMLKAKNPNSAEGHGLDVSVLFCLHSLNKMNE